VRQQLLQQRQRQGLEPITSSSAKLPWLAEAVRAADQQQQQGEVQDDWEQHWQQKLSSAEEEIEKLQQQLARRRAALKQQDQQKRSHKERQFVRTYMKLQELKATTLRELQEAEAPTAAGASTAVADEDVIRHQLARQMQQLSCADPALAVPTEQLPALTNSNIARLQPAAHAAAQALLEQESAAGAQGLGPLPAGEETGRIGEGRGAGGTSEAEKQRIIDAVNTLGSSYRSSCCTGAYGRAGQPSPAVLFTPQTYANYTSRPLTTATVCVDSSGRQLLQLQNTNVTSDPAKLAKLMDTPHKFAAAQRACLRAMAEARLVTMETIPQWEVFWCAWERLSEFFTARGNWGGFLAANHKAWVAMYERGLPPDADYGRIDMLELLPYMSWQQHGGMGGGSSSSGGGAKGGSSGNSGAGAEQCRMFQQGTCTRGAACRFKH
jgi:hypothetical protein